MTDRKIRPDTDGRTRDGKFASGNPGKPKGARNRATLDVERILSGSADKLTERVLSLALEGDTTAIRLCLERIAPPRKDTPVSFDLPRIKSAHDAADAAAAVLAAVSEGEITPLEGASVMGLVENYRRVLEASDFEARIAALEDAQ